MTYNIKDIKKVEIVWKDAYSFSDTYTREQLEKRIQKSKDNPLLYRNIGYMIEQNEEFVALIQHLDDQDGQWHLAKKLWIIPSPYIVSLTELKCV